MSAITKEQQQAIFGWLATHTLTVGLGTKESACSIAAINLALTGKLTDRIPECMSPVIGHWIIRVQDTLPHEMRNSLEWKALLPLAAGTGRAQEGIRSRLILDWMWTVVLPALQNVADTHGFGEAWQFMLQDKTRESAQKTYAAAYAAAYDVAYAAYAAAYVAAAALGAYVDDVAAAAAALGAYVADVASEASPKNKNKVWEMFNPCGLLQKLINLEE